MPPWLHQLAVLFTGWAIFFIRLFTLHLTNIFPQSNFLPADLWPFFMGPNFSQPFPSILPSHLVTLLTYLPTDLPLSLNPKPNQLTTNPLPTLSILSWQNLYLFLVKLLSFGQTYISFWVTFFYWQKLHFFLAKFLSLGETYIFSWLNIFILAKLIFCFWFNFCLLAKLVFFLAKHISILGSIFVFWKNPIFFLN